MIIDNILQAIGNTPSVKLNRVGSNLNCNLYAKCEFLNPGGSVKDRIGYQMVVKAMEAGQIKQGDTLIEPTSGNAGIGIALAAAVLGFKMIITMPEKMSHEKQVVLESLGAKIYRTPTEAAWDAPDSHISLAIQLQQEIPNSHILDQYKNPNNPGAHHEFTAQEIIDDFGKDLHMLVAGVGTGGTISGLAKRLKDYNPELIVVGVDPIGSILGGGTQVSSYAVEGIGYDFFPEVLNNGLIDKYIKINDQDSFTTARQLIKEEGLLVGGSSGSAVWAAMQAAEALSTGQNCLVILPDSIRNYLTKFPDDEWMKKEGFAL